MSGCQNWTWSAHLMLCSVVRSCSSLMLFGTCTHFQGCIQDLSEGGWPGWRKELHPQTPLLLSFLFAWAVWEQHQLCHWGRGSREGKMEKWHLVHRRTCLGSVVRLRAPGSCFSEFSCERIIPRCSGEIERDSSGEWRLWFSLSCHSAAPLGKL